MRGLLTILWHTVKVKYRGSFAHCMLQSQHSYYLWWLKKLMHSIHSFCVCLYSTQCLSTEHHHRGCAIKGEYSFEYLKRIWSVYYSQNGQFVHSVYSYMKPKTVCFLSLFKHMTSVIENRSTLKSSIPKLHRACWMSRLTFTFVVLLRWPLLGLGDISNILDVSRLVLWCRKWLYREYLSIHSIVTQLL